MRLIDADETIKQYTQIFVEKYGIECGEMFQGVLKQMPTAYDVDKVIEELKEMGNEYCKSVKCNGECDCCEHASMMQSAIKIVKGGGIDA